MTGSLRRAPETHGAAGYVYSGPAPNHTARYLWPTVLRLLASEVPAGGRVFDLGCGNGTFAQALDRCGFAVSGVDPSVSGIQMANHTFPHLDLHNGSAYDDLAGRFGPHRAVVSLEVVEHLYAPRIFASTLSELLVPGGIAIVSTPYHGYWKNVALALTGRMEAHFTALWDHGHIKFWSRRTLEKLLREAGFDGIQFRRVGRVPALAKSMIAIARKPC